MWLQDTSVGTFVNTEARVPGFDSHHLIMFDNVLGAHTCKFSSFLFKLYFMYFFIIAVPILKTCYGMPYHNNYMIELPSTEM